MGQICTGQPAFLWAAAALLCMVGGDERLIKDRVHCRGWLALLMNVLLVKNHLFTFLKDCSLHE